MVRGTPRVVVESRLRLAGLDASTREQVLAALPEVPHGIAWPDDSAIDVVGSDHRDGLRIVLEYDRLRASGTVRPIVLALEGASATGKSVVALEMVQCLAPTRTVTTDTVRQVLRAVLSAEQYPELFCHTYQAHKYRRAGPEGLNRAVRGYLAQCAVMQPAISGLVARVIYEGVDAVVEGVHLVPGTLEDSRNGDNVLEVVLNPPEELHRAMFLSKGLTGLRTVDNRTEVREEEFAATREIQEYLVGRGKQAGCHIIEAGDLTTAAGLTRELVLRSMGRLIVGLSANR